MSFKLSDDFKPITLQRVFDAAWQAFIVEDKPPAKEANRSCQYLTADGRKCAIGLLIPDGHPAQKAFCGARVLTIEFPELFDPLVNVRDLENAQGSLHDYLCEWSAHWVLSRSERAARYVEFADMYGLTVPAGKDERAL